MAAGNATIVATVSNAGQQAEARATVTVVPAAKSITITPNADSAGVGHDRAFAATLTADPGVATGIRWRSSNSAIATVDQTGKATAVALGSVTLTALAEADSTVRATATFRVVGQTSFTSWNRRVVGRVNGQITDGLALDVVSLSSGSALASYWAFADGTAPNFAMRLGPSGLVDITQSPEAAVQGLTSADPSEAFGLELSIAGLRVVRWNGTTWSLLPVAQPGPMLQLRAIGGGQVIGISRNAATPGLYRWDGTAWSTLLPISMPPSGVNPTFWAGSTSAVAYAICSSVTQRFTYNGTTTTALPAPPGTPSNSCPSFLGHSLTNLYSIENLSRDKLFLWNGTTWTAQTSGLPAGDPILSGTMCGTSPVVVTERGRVYRLNSGSFGRLGTDQDNLPNRFFGFSRRPISCAPDGTIRTAAGEGSLARWSGSAWVVEGFQPSFRAVHLVSPTLGWAAGGAYSLYRITDQAWNLAYRATEDADRRIGSIAAWADGKLIAALWSSVGAASVPQPHAHGILRYDGANWIRDNLAEFSLVNAVWGSSYDNAFAVTGTGLISKFNGTTWQTQFTAAGPLFLVGGTGPGYALAVGENLRTIRFNGTAWAQIVGAVGSNNPSQLYLAAPDDAWVATTGGLVHRFNGAAWTAVDMNQAGGVTRTWALFGTGSNDVYAVRGPIQGPRVLYRWNGTQWSTMPGFNPGAMELVEAGSSAGGVATLVGTAGTVYTTGPIFQAPR